jgi:hypothetical protein
MRATNVHRSVTGQGYWERTPGQNEYGSNFFDS